MAVLVTMKMITLKEAEYIVKKLGHIVVPDTVKDCVKDILKVRKQYEQKSK